MDMTVIATGETEKIELSWDDINKKAFKLACLLKQDFENSGHKLVMFPIPRGGIYAALAVQGILRGMGIYTDITDDPDNAVFYIDDILESGATRDQVFASCGVKPFYVLVDKQNDELHEWVVFPWERAVKENGPQDNIRRILQYIGEDVDREGLKETPDRVVKSYAELFSGYKEDPADHLKVFEEGACQEMVLLKDIEFYSHCEHHMLPFFGKAHIAYIPDQRVIGVSKLARILDVFTRRLQIQERICQQVTEALEMNLRPKGAACILEAVHFCMVCRGVQKQNSKMVTSSLKGAFLEPAVRQELLSLIRQ